MKISHKARHGRKRHPVPHRPYRKATAYSRAARRLKWRMALLFAPTISEGLGEGEVRMRLHGRTRLLVGGALPGDFTTNRASADVAASPVTRR